MRRPTNRVSVEVKSGNQAEPEPGAGVAQNENENENCSVLGTDKHADKATGTATRQYELCLPSAAHLGPSRANMKGLLQGLAYALVLLKACWGSGVVYNVLRSFYTGCSCASLFCICVLPFRSKVHGDSEAAKAAGKKCTLIDAPFPVVRILIAIAKW